MMSEEFKPKITYKVAHTYVDPTIALNFDNMMRKANPWQKWFAWKPVRDIHGERWWLKTVYRRRELDTYANHVTGPGYEYGTIFDVLKEA